MAVLLGSDRAENQAQKPERSCLKESHSAIPRGTVAQKHHQCFLSASLRIDIASVFNYLELATYLHFARTLEGNQAFGGD
jgi:hypothetical protein